MPTARNAGIVWRMEFTPAQCRAARGLLDMSQDELAAASRVSRRTVTSFEAGATPIPATLAAIRRALEAAGVEFLDGDGVRLRQAR